MREAIRLLAPLGQQEGAGGGTGRSRRRACQTGQDRRSRALCARGAGRAAHSRAPAANVHRACIGSRASRPRSATTKRRRSTARLSHWPTSSTSPASRRRRYESSFASSRAAAATVMAGPYEERLAALVPAESTAEIA